MNYLTNFNTPSKQRTSSWEEVFGNFLSDIKLRVKTDNYEKSPLNDKFFLENKKIKFQLKNDPLLTISPLDSDNKKIQNTNFPISFLKYLNGQSSLQDLIDKNNFPKENMNNEQFESRKKIINIISNSVNKNLVKQNENEMKYFLQRLEQRNQEKIEKEKKISDVKSHFNILKNLVIGKIQEKEQDFSKSSDIRNLNFFRNFHDVFVQYMNKIKNKDLINKNSEQKYYSRPNPTTKYLKEFNLLREKDSNYYCI